MANVNNKVKYKVFGVLCLQIKLCQVSSTLQNEPYIEEHAWVVDSFFLHFNPPVACTQVQN